jgi:hypothetical protein
MTPSMQESWLCPKPPFMALLLEFGDFGPFCLSSKLYNPT